MDDSCLSTGHHPLGSQNSSKENIKYNVLAGMSMGLTRLPSTENSPEREDQVKKIANQR